MLALSNQLIENKALMFGAAAIAFFVAAVLILFVFRLAFGRRLHMPGGRARQMRLGIVDAFDLDRQRQLVIVRRDNIEHLIMIGGPNDLLIESQIVRAEARGRDKEVREREATHAPTVALPVKPPAAEPKLPIPSPAPEPQPVAEVEPSTPPPTTAPLPGLAALSAGTRAPSSMPSPRRPAPTTAPKPAPVQERPSAEPEPTAAPSGKPATSAPQPTLQPATRWPTRSPATPTQMPFTPKRPPSKPIPTAAPPAPQGKPEPPATEPAVAGPPVPSLEGLESLEEEMAKLLGRGPTKP